MIIKRILDALAQARADRANAKAQRAMGRRPLGGWDRAR